MNPFFMKSLSVNPPHLLRLCFAEMRRGDTYGFRENPAEMVLALITDQLSNFIIGFFAMLQFGFGFLHLQLDDEIPEVFPCIFLINFGELFLLNSTNSAVS
jgi:hypothetical protein